MDQHLAVAILTAWICYFFWLRFVKMGGGAGRYCGAQQEGKRNSTRKISVSKSRSIESSARWTSHIALLRLGECASITNLQSLTIDEISRKSFSCPGSNWSSFFGVLPIADIRETVSFRFLMWGNIFRAIGKNPRRNCQHDCHKPPRSIAARERAASLLIFFYYLVGAKSEKTGFPARCRRLPGVRFLFVNPSRDCCSAQEPVAKIYI